MAEFLRRLRTLQALQAEARAADNRRPARRRGRQIVPANGRTPIGRAAAPATVPHPLATRRDLVATAARRAIVPTTNANRGKAFAETIMPPALASLLAATKRTQANTQTQDLVLPTKL